MIVKLQTSLNDGGQMLLVYNEDRSIFEQFPVDQKIKDLMGDRVKAYFKARVGKGELEILGPAPEQGW